MSVLGLPTSLYLWAREQSDVHDSKTRWKLGFITVGQENSTPIDLYYEDHGAGPAVVLSHGWPLSSAAWEKQASALLTAGYRVIAYDRRGFGKSSQPSTGYDYDTFADDLHHLVTMLELTSFAMAGHSMGGGEVAGCIRKYGTSALRKAMFISPVPPFLEKTVDNPTGVAASVFTDIQNSIRADRPAHLTTFLSDFFNVDVELGKRVSTEVVQAHWNIACGASPTGTLECVNAWLTDFRAVCASIDIPSVIIHGDADRILPIDATAKPLAALIPHAQLVVIKDGSHGIPWTHADEVNGAMLAFLA